MVSVTDREPIFEFRPFDRPERGIGAIAGFVVMAAIVDSGQHVLVGYSLYLLLITLPRALAFEASKVSYLAEKHGLPGLLLPWAFLPFPTLPPASAFLRLGVATVNWLIVWPGLAYLIGLAVHKFWS
jgi:hypothetical protein